MNSPPSLVYGVHTSPKILAWLGYIQTFPRSYAPHENALIWLLTQCLIGGYASNQQFPYSTWERETLQAKLSPNPNQVDE